ncbi:MAG: hypothetical protein KJ944_08545 [Alphaproteobacteria bacterium]|nr:hypothetical protein [Alphaproteobacteria bacterium]MBU1561536.1 hypothetical protein [Alphaproteobacteria bacterium]MBU2302631.1 hypothetical protein [Alphaproteobacteria bacterium]MBU2367705.1 hypothetical protein [Alphaproteobacteria bacterium]
MAKFHVNYEPVPGKVVPLMFTTEAARAAFIASKPGRAKAVRAAAAPKRAVTNLRQIGA